MTIKTGFESDEPHCRRKTSGAKCVKNINHHHLLSLNATFSLTEQSRVESASQHTDRPLVMMQTAKRRCVFNDSFAFVSLCRQVLRGGQVFPKEQHDFVSNGLWGGPAERELWDTGSIVGTSWQQQSAPHFTHEMDVLLHLEKDKRLSACLQYFLRPLYQSLRTLL